MQNNMRDKDWFYLVRDNHDHLPSFIDHFYQALEQGREEIKTKGRLEDHLKKLPVIAELYFNKLQVIEMVLEHFNLELDKIHAKLYKKYMEGYQRILPEKAIEKYIKGEPDIIDQKELINEIALLRNAYHGLSKSLADKNFNLGHITKLRVAGLDDARVD